jgi:hypothetical protein
MKPVLYVLVQDGSLRTTFREREIYARVSRSAQTDLCF